jgi:hypothetical protein
MMTALEAARDALALVDGVATCKIGQEANLSPADYPLIRIVPVRITPGRPYNNRTAEVLIYFGMDRGESEDGLEDLYDRLFTMEAAILEVVRTLQGRWVETLTDRDELPAYKIMAIRCELQG